MSSRFPVPKSAAKGVLFGGLLVLLALCLGRSRAVSLPVLMYHHIAKEVPSDMTVSPARFEEHIAALTQDGWHAVTISQLIDYVDGGTPLPDKPVLITFDDGYTSNLELAAPVLEQYGQRAVIFSIGINAGQAYYVHTGAPLLPPRFALEEALPWVESGVVEIQSHTFDLHQLESYGVSGRNGVLPLPGEREEVYREALTLDAQKQRELFSRTLGREVTALAYPFGFSSETAEEVFSGLGVRVTFTTDPGPNRVCRGQPDTLRKLNRYTMTERVTGERLLELLDQT